MQLDDTICYCFHVSKRKILNFIRVQKPRRASQVSGCGGAGTGCGWCVRYLERYFQEANRTQGDGPSATETELTPAEYEQQRQAYIAAGKGRPPR
ncbi:MAG: (2Fe-2S)-binding protein [Planctomycetaceae bacterium]|jgi:NAD(P)H-nitrite reductase large subunit